VRRAILVALAVALVAACAAAPGPASDASVSEPPILFVHGNGDSAALWITTLWRFESNGYPRDRLFAMDLIAPTARDDDAVPQANRSSTAEVRDQLAAKVDQILARTGSAKVALVASSRGANAVRSYLKSGGADKAGWAMLGGGVNHGVYATPGGPNSEFNGAAAFMRQLNDGAEVMPGVRYLTLRSDRLDKFAQPELAPGRSSGIGYDAPALRGATNVVLDGLDHREIAFSARAFVEMYRFLTGNNGSADIVVEDRPRLSGYVGGYENRAPTNRGVAGVTVTIYEVDGETGLRRGAAVHTSTTGVDGSWGTFIASPTAFYEFLVQAAGQPVRHVFRSPFPRSSDHVSLRLSEDAPPSAGTGLVIFTRPRGYIADGRDAHSFDGSPVPGVAPGIPTSASFRIETTRFDRGLPAVLNGERLMIRAFPGEIVYAEFHH